MALFLGELMDMPNLTYFRLLNRKNKHTVVVPVQGTLFLLQEQNTVIIVVAF